MNEKWPFVSAGIPDHFFQRAPGVPMTKQEVRALSVSQMRLFPGATVYDVGAGTGSVAVECALLGCRRVFAIEKNREALNLLKENISVFNLDNIEIINGTAPDVLGALPEVDRIFIGGSGGNLLEILECISKKLKSGGRLVVNSVTLATGPEVMSFLQESNFDDINITSINVSKAVSRGKVHLWQAQNPVQIISSQKGEI